MAKVQNTGEHYRNLSLSYAGEQEQAKILEFIAGESAPLDAAVSRLECEIELLREYRTRLVADVVTGKLDVREAATRLPQEAAHDVGPDDTESIDETEPAEQEVV
jgi:type I restriction enzyme S subunit